MQSLATLFVALAIFSSANAHMSLSWPPPFRAAINPYAVQSQIDYSITSPLSPDGSNFPCKGYQSDLGTSGGKSVVTWAAGTQYNFTVLGSAVHGGGSCQAALSYDKGVSWKVIHSYQGSCPLADGENFDFTIPSDAPSTGSDGTIFAWLWYNEIGNREIYMSCASVTVNAGSSGTRSAPATAYSSRPDLFVANLGNGCTTVEGKEVQFPNPGPDADVTNKYTVTDDSGSFTGTCKAVKSIGGEAGSGSSSSSNSAAPAASGGSSSASSSVASQQPTTLATSVYSVPSLSNPTSTSAQSGGIFATVSASSSAEASSASTEASSTPAVVSSAPASTGTGSVSSGLTVSEDGECSGTHTCNGSPHGPCCSQWGWCGSTSDYCGTGCMAGFGQCGNFVNGTSSAGSATPSSAKFRFRARA